MKELSIFIDESGDFGMFNHHSPYYIISLVFHEQNNDVSAQIKEFDNKLSQLDFANHSIHTAPIIRKESSYIDIDIALRRKLLSLTMGFILKLILNGQQYLLAKSNLLILTKKFLNLQKNFQIS